MATAAVTINETDQLEHLTTSTNSPLNGVAKAKRPINSAKYRHFAAVHSKPRTSCLSHDSEHSPSFLGFRNLMVIVLS